MSLYYTDIYTTKRYLHTHYLVYTTHGPLTGVPGDPRGCAAEALADEGLALVDVGPTHQIERHLVHTVVGRE
jgi:hypothetical protein